MKLYDWLMDTLFPPKCILCRKLLSREETDLCNACREEAPAYHISKTTPQFLDSFVAVWYYEDSVRESLLRFKFRGARSYGEVYGRLVAMKLLETVEGDFDLLTWIPVSPLRKLRRGYDQVELIAKSVGAELGVEPVPTLKKIRHNRPQSRISDGAKRRANVLGAYCVMDPEVVSGKRIVLLDDILTTGATMSEAARMLKTAGAKEVHSAAVAARK